MAIVGEKSPLYFSLHYILLGKIVLFTLLHLDQLQFFVIDYFRPRHVHLAIIRYKTIIIEKCKYSFCSRTLFSLVLFHYSSFNPSDLSGDHLEDPDL